MMIRLLVTTILLAGFILILGGSPVRASGVDPGAIEAFYLVQNGRLTAEQKKSFDELPPEEQERIRKNYNKFKGMPALKQDQLRKRYEKWQELPQEHRQKLRKDLKKEMEQPRGKAGRK